MATSGTITYSMTAGQLVAFALKKIRVEGAASTVAAEDMADAIEELNIMLKGWQMMPESPNLWRQTEGSVTLVAATASYLLSPRPYRVISARYRDASGRDLPLEEMTREEYQSLPLKTSAGTPNGYYVDYQRAGATMYVWPVPASVTTETIKYDYQRVFEDVTNQAQDIDIPQEYHDVIGYNLADRLQDTFGKDVKAVTRRAQYLLAAASSADRESYVQIIPERR